MNQASKKLTQLLMRSNQVKGRVLVNIEKIEEGEGVKLYPLGSDKVLMFKGKDESFHLEDTYENISVIGMAVEIKSVEETEKDDLEVTFEVQGTTNGEITMNGEEMQKFFNIDRMNIYRDLPLEERTQFLDALKGEELRYLDFESELEITFKVIEHSEYDTVTVELNGEVAEFAFDSFLIIYDEYLAFQEYVEEQELEDLDGPSNVIGPDGTPLTNLEVRFERMRQHQEKLMEEYGFISHCVMPTEEENNGFIDFHTHGFAENYGHKDIQMVMPVDPKILNVIAHDILDKIIKKGLKLEEHTDKVIDKYDVEIMEVEDEEGRGLLRIMFPDPKGKLPSDPLCELMYKKQMKKNLF